MNTASKVTHSTVQTKYGIHFVRYLYCVCKRPGRDASNEYPHVFMAK